jgi:predicted nuclease of restriction endonuclease-like RecB superfamily
MSSESRKVKECQLTTDSLAKPQSKIWSRSDLIQSILTKHPRVSLEQLESSLLKGTGGEKFLKKVISLGDSIDLPRKINGILVKKLMMRALVIEIIIKDQSRRIVRQAKLQGLICEIRKKENSHIQLRISGPLALFGPTTIYGRRLQAFIPLLFWNLEFKLRATFRSQGHSYFFFLDSLSPLKTSKPPVLFDSKLEEVFYVDFRKQIQFWDLIREPEPIVMEERMFFPDFALTHKTLQSESIYIEIIGYWTDAYVKKKLEEVSFMDNKKMIFIVNVKLKDTIEKNKLYLLLSGGCQV